MFFISMWVSFSRRLKCHQLFHLQSKRMSALQKQPPPHPTSLHTHIHTSHTHTGTHTHTHICTHARTHAHTHNPLVSSLCISLCRPLATGRDEEEDAQHLRMVKGMKRQLTKFKLTAFFS